MRKFLNIGEWLMISTIIPIEDSGLKCRIMGGRREEKKDGEEEG